MRTRTGVADAAQSPSLCSTSTEPAAPLGRGCWMRPLAPRSPPCLQSRPSAVGAAGASAESAAGGGDQACSYRFFPAILTDYWTGSSRSPGTAGLGQQRVSPSSLRRCRRSLPAERCSEAVPCCWRQLGSPRLLAGLVAAEPSLSFAGCCILPQHPAGVCLVFASSAGWFLTDILLRRRSSGWGF